MKRAASQLWRGEAWLGLLAASVTASLWLKTGLSGLTITALCTTLLLGTTLLFYESGSRMRLAVSYLVALAGYDGSALLVEALQVPVRSHAVLDWDRLILGETPAVVLSSFQSAGLRCNVFLDQRGLFELREGGLEVGW